MSSDEKPLKWAHEPFEQCLLYLREERKFLQVCISGLMAVRHRPRVLEALAGYDKVMDWSGNVNWLKEHFAKTRLKNYVPLALLHVLILELISGVLCIVRCIELLVNSGRAFGLYGGIFSCITLPCSSRR